MPYPIPDGKSFHIEHRLLSADYQMPFMQVNNQYYSMGFLISGDRITITPTKTYIQHPGALGTMPPFQYHQTFPASDAPYESILLKFMPEFVKPFTDYYGDSMLESVYAYRSNIFEKSYEKKLNQLFFDMVDMYESSSAFKELHIKCLLFELFALIIEHAIPAEDTIVYREPLSKEIMESICYIESHYFENFNIDELALRAGFSVSHFSRLFKKQLGQNYSDYLAMVRIQHAQALLLNTSKSVTEIASETGFSYSSKLSEAFRKKTGMTPLSYRRANKKESHKTRFSASGEFQQATSSSPPECDSCQAVFVE